MKTKKLKRHELAARSVLRTQKRLLNLERRVDELETLLVRRLDIVLRDIGQMQLRIGRVGTPAFTNG